VRADLFALNPVESNFGWFDDVPNHAESLWGGYLTVPAPIVSRGQAAFYCIGLDSKSATITEALATSFHRGLELLMDSGLTPLQAINLATGKAAAAVLGAPINTDWHSVSTCKHHACQMTVNDDGRRT